MSDPVLSPESDDEIVASTSQGTEPPKRSPYTMTEEILQKRLKHVNKGRYMTQLCAAIAASLAALSFGTSLGWSSPATRHLMGPINIYNLTEDNFAWVSSLMPLGCSFGIIPWSYMVKKYGSKHTLMIQAPCSVLAFLLRHRLKTFRSYLASRFLSGFLAIAGMIAGECFLMDTVHRGNLTHMIVFFRSSVWLGVLSTYLIGNYLSKSWLSAIIIGIPSINTILLIFLPETPVFLYDKSEVKAEQALSWYRGHTNIYTEMRSIRKDAELRKIGTESYKYMFFSKAVYRGFFIVLGLNFFQVFCGYYAFVFYALMIWKESTVYTPFMDSLTFGICLYVSNFVGNLVHYRVPFGVRKPLLVSTTLTALVLSVVCVALGLHKLKIINIHKIHWLPLVMLDSFVVTYEMGLGTYPDILLFDYLPYQVHVQAKTMSRMWFWFQVFLLTKLFILVRNVGGYGVVFGGFTGITYMGILFCYLFVVETKGKNLMQIQIEIGGNPIGNRGAYRNRIGAGALLRYR